MSDEKEMYLWSENYRPHTVNDCILPPRLKTYFQAIVDKGQLANMTLVGGPGTGKTTVARAMCEELKIDHIVINASENGNIETIRTTVRQFASTVSFGGGIKAIILDEADGLTKNAQQALRASIEEFAGNCRFIFTGNFGNQIIEPLTSRAPIVEIVFSKEEKKALLMEFLKKVAGVLKSKGIAFTPEELTQVIVKNFPDFRKTWNLIQRYSANGSLEITSQTGINDGALKELIDYLKGKKFGDMRKWVVDHLDNDAASLRRSLYEKMAVFVKPQSIPQLVLIIAEYDYKEGHVMDKEINTVAMLTTMMADVEFV
ncbi:DNA polymerase accessory protein sliding clamp [Xanthomonas phage X1]|nr:DNA polymerase accessory protein sliding clamp [Xanthomonas phage X1]